MQHVHRMRRTLTSHVHSAQRAFTLVELLVVIGIIAVLIAILMPALSTARRSALITQCLAVQRQIGTAAQMHVSAHRGYYPVAGNFSGINDADPQSLQDANKQKYTYVFVTDINGAPWSKQTVVPWHASLAVYMGKPQAVLGQNNVDFLEDQIGIRDYLKYFLCPAHTSRSVDAESAVIYSTERILWSVSQSYVVNEAVFGINDARGRLRGQAAKVRDPSRTLMLMDGKGAQTMSTPYFYVTITNATYLGNTVQGKRINSFPLSEGLAPTTTPPIVRTKENFDKLRHKGRMNILFMDGHAETRRVEPGDLNDVYLLPPVK
jgi:prepilin-type processing-associated H-X9-DG protein/prepilin-type N-terminal cleavage/methylation domain-containing protein